MGTNSNGGLAVPSWFRISNYFEMKDKHAAEWHVNLFIRHELHKYYKERRKAAQKPLTGDASVIFNLLKKKPIIDRDLLLSGGLQIDLTGANAIDGDDLDFDIALLNEACEAITFPREVVRPVDNHGILATAMLFPKEIADLLHVVSGEFDFQSDCMRSYYFNTEKDKRKFSELYDAFHDSLNPERQERAFNAYNKFKRDCLVDNWLEIDPNLSDKILVDAFLKVVHSLREKRTHLKKTKARHRELNTWYRNGMLAFLDLEFWRMLEGESREFETDVLCDKFIQIALHDEGDDPTTIRSQYFDKLEAALDKYPKEMMSDGILRALEAQAIKERNEVEKSGKLLIGGNLLSFKNE